MKYIPLVWASIMRKPARAILTLLSVMLAFTLFGLILIVTSAYLYSKRFAQFVNTLLARANLI